MKDWNRSISALMHLAKLRARRRWAEGKDGELDVVIRKFLYCCKSADGFFSCVVRFVTFSVLVPNQIC